jgi:hypothetical protein
LFAVEDFDRLAHGQQLGDDGVVSGGGAALHRDVLEQLLGVPGRDLTFRGYFWPHPQEERQVRPARSLVAA